MVTMRNFFRGLDPYLIGATAVLLALGAIALSSASIGRDNRELVTQGLAGGLGIFGAFFLASLHPRTVHKFRHYIFFGAVLALILVLIFGRTIKGTRGWFVLGSATLQPVEFAKIALVIVLASVLPLHARLRSLRSVLGASVATALFVVLTFLQPDFG
jgi:rod shape determining protein RodA